MLPILARLAASIGGRGAAGAAARGTANAATKAPRAYKPVAADTAKGIGKYAPSSRRTSSEKKPAGVFQRAKDAVWQHYSDSKDSGSNYGDEYYDEANASGSHKAVRGLLKGMTNNHAFTMRMFDAIMDKRGLASKVTDIDKKKKEIDKETKEKYGRPATTDPTKPIPEKKKTSGIDDEKSPDGVQLKILTKLEEIRQTILDGGKINTKIAGEGLKETAKLTKYFYKQMGALKAVSAPKLDGLAKFFKETPKKIKKSGGAINPLMTDANKFAPTKEPKIPESTISNGGEAGGGLIDKLMGFLGNGVKSAGGAIGQVGRQAGGLLSGVGGKLMGAARFALPAAAVAGAGYLGYKAGGMLNDYVLNPLAEKITGDKDATVGTALYDGVDKVQSLWGGDDKSKMDGKEFKDSPAGKVVESVKESTKGLFTKLSDTVSKGTANVKEVVSGGFVKMGETLTKGMDELADTDLGSTISAGFSRVKEGVSQGYQAVKERGGQVYDSVKEGVKTAHEKAAEGAKFVKEKASAGYESLKNIAGEGLGALSAKFESGRKGSEAVGWDSTGGTSYGKYQIASKTGSMDKFMNYVKDQNPEVYDRLKKAGPADGGKDGAFAKEWQSLAKEGKMGDLEHDFIKKTHFDEGMKGVKDPELAKKIEGSKALQDVMWSTSVQHGGGSAEKGSGAAGIFNKVYKEGMSEDDLIKAVYAERGTKFGSSTKGVQESVQKRLKEEEKLALGMVGQKPGDLKEQVANKQINPETGQVAKTPDVTQTISPQAVDYAKEKSEGGTELYKQVPTKPSLSAPAPQLASDTRKKANGINYANLSSSDEVKKEAYARGGTTLAKMTLGGGVDDYTMNNLGSVEKAAPGKITAGDLEKVPTPSSSSNVEPPTMEASAAASKPVVVPMPSPAPAAAPVQARGDGAAKAQAPMVPRNIDSSVRRVTDALIGYSMA